MAAPAPASAPAPCAHCGGAGALRCAGCRGVHYCSRGCQKAAWPGHKERCKLILSTMYKGQQLTSERGFVREHWARHLPPGCDVEALLGPPGEPLDAAGAFERCQAAAMDGVLPGWSGMPEEQRGACVALCLESSAARRSRGEAARSRANLATDCIDRLCPAALDQLLSAGVRPGDVSVVYGGSLLQAAAATLLHPYAQSPAALPHALASLRVVLAHAQPGDWLVKGSVEEHLPLFTATGISNPAVSQAVLDAIVASPGGFPAHAVAASPSIVLHALHRSKPAFVLALLAAGADPNAPAPMRLYDDTTSMMRPLHSLVIGNLSDDPRDFGAKLRLLLDAGVDLEATIESGRTALVEAAVNKRPAAFDALLVAGAQASALRFNCGSDAARFNTVLHQLAGSNDAPLITRVLATRVLDVDVRAGPAPTWRRFTPLHTAAYLDAPRAVSALLAGGASLMATNADGMPALQVAIDRSCAQAARPLVEATPVTARARAARDAAYVLAVRARDAAARPGDVDATVKLAAARAIAALLAA
jgi:hypothetical protein